MDTKSEIKEGKYFNYTIQKHIELNENEGFYMLIDEFGRKKLLPSEHYLKYNFKIGDEIICRIDHINCSGKVFLEPAHPFYKEGDIYTFIVLQTFIEKNKLGNDIRVIEVEDKLKETATCKIDNTNIRFKQGDEIECKVERIKKGKLYLSYLEENTKPILDIGEYYFFKIIDQKVLNDGRSYYILNDKSGNSYLLNDEYYDHHNLNVGKDIECIVQKFSSKGYYVLEPKHPYYKKGEVYEFTFDRQFASEKEIMTSTFEVVVKDVYNEEVRFITEKVIREKGKLKCKVTGIKKGKPLLVLSN